MKIGFIFPGQGAQYVGMGKDIYEKYEQVREIYKKANEILKIDIAKLSFEETEEKLNQTKNTQIATLIMSLAILEILKKKNIKAEITAGLSLGEYTALIYAGAFSLEDGIKIVQKRGEIMQKYVPKDEWSMAAIMGLENHKIEEICKNITTGFVTPANYNCLGQTVISGNKSGVNQAIEQLKQNGAKKVISLKTSGPFHTIKLKEASEKLKEELEKTKTSNHLNCTVIKNIDATPYTIADDLNEILTKHVISPVRFSETITKMIELGVDTFIEIGPGKVLAGFVKKINKDVRVFSVNNVESLENILQEFK